MRPARLDEIFDKWDGTASITAATDFEEFAARNARNWLLRDRNHPSVFLWSVGNEIGDAQWNNNNGFQRLHTMVNLVDRYDPSRPVTMVSDNVDAPVRRAFDYYDVLSWNYDRRWRLARQLEPNKSVIISESASTVSTRGFYEFRCRIHRPRYEIAAGQLVRPARSGVADRQTMPHVAAGRGASRASSSGPGSTTSATHASTDLRRAGLDPGASRSSASASSTWSASHDHLAVQSYWTDDTTVHPPALNWPDRVEERAGVRLLQRRLRRHS
jgi:beta-galactosidase